MGGPIIFLDDDEDDHGLIKAICKNLKICNKLMFFDNGHNFIKYLKTTPENPFIIFSDINMPLMNGLEVIRSVNENIYLKEKKIPFIFLSTVANEFEVAQAYEEGALGFFVKGYSLNEIENTLRTILQYWRTCKRS